MTNPDEVSLVEKLRELQSAAADNGSARGPAGFASRGELEALAASGDDLYCLLPQIIEELETRRLIIDTLGSATPLVKLREALDWLDANRRLSVEHYSPTYCDDDDQSEEWRIIRQGGSINDREYTCVGRGETPLDAILDARTALSSNLEGG